MYCFVNNGESTKSNVSFHTGIDVPIWGDPNSPGKGVHINFMAKN